MFAFHSTLIDCDLCDLGFKGQKFTWSNCREGRDLTLERLDRVVANREWCRKFNVVEVEALPRFCSDHSPLIISFDPAGSKSWMKTNMFHFEAGWLKYAEHKNMVKAVWRIKGSSSDKWRVLTKKLDSCRDSLKIWAGSSVNQESNNVKMVEEELRKVQMEGDPSGMAKEKELKGKLDHLLELEDLKWRQRARENWLRFGDKNTKFFHACASHRKSRNSIKEIIDLDGKRWNDHKGVERAFSRYFHWLYKSDGNGEVECCVNSIQPKVSAEMNHQLVAPVSMEEIQLALNQMDPLKAPGPDGFPACFFQQNWEILHKEVYDAIKFFFDTCQLDASINYTVIALIPKTKNPKSVLDFRPISLCNVVYKVLSKVLANRLKVILPSIISESQSAFIPGRLITDNIIAAFETMHTMHTKMWGRTRYMGIKLDMSKAYDRVEWMFLEAVMSKMGFDPLWIKMIMVCVRTVSYSVAINGNVVGNILPSRGLRQGDPISPYLFIICAKAFSSLLSNAQAKGLISSVPTSKKGPSISHLFFADDSVVFCKANRVEWRRILNIIEIYEKGSGQRINVNKTAVFFSRNTKDNRRKEIIELFGSCRSKQI